MQQDLRALTSVWNIPSSRSRDTIDHWQNYRIHFCCLHRDMQILVCSSGLPVRVDIAQIWCSVRARTHLLPSMLRTYYKQVPEQHLWMFICKICSETCFLVKTCSEQCFGQFLEASMSGPYDNWTTTLVINYIFLIYLHVLKEYFTWRIFEAAIIAMIIYYLWSIT